MRGEVTKMTKVQLVNVTLWIKCQKLVLMLHYSLVSHNSIPSICQDLTHTSLQCVIFKKL